MLRFEGYKKIYGSGTVLEIPELVLPYGIYWLRGENGAGKSTLLKSAAALIPFEGDIFSNGSSLKKNRRPYLRQVNFAPAEPVYPDFLTGNDLIAFYQQTKGSFPDTVAFLTDRFGMKHYLDRKLGGYSSGMLKKLSLVLAFIGEAKWILLDEPFVTLDAAAQQELAQYIRQRATGDATGFCISTHQDLLDMQHDVLEIADHKIVRTHAAVTP